MATNVILPALGMAQETGKIVRWLKTEGEQVTKGEPLVEIETDKATVEIEAPASGVLTNVTEASGAEIPVGQTIALIMAAAEAFQGDATTLSTPAQAGASQNTLAGLSAQSTRTSGAAISPLASRIAAEHNLDVSQVKPGGRRIQKADVLAHLQSQEKGGSPLIALDGASTAARPRLVMASPKARRLATERGQDLATFKGTGPGGAVLTVDVLAVTAPTATIAPEVVATSPDSDMTAEVAAAPAISHELTLTNVWRIMAERTTQSWTSVPHFFLVREVNASRLIAWREQMLRRSTEKITYSDLLVKIVAAVLCEHPRLNASWNAGSITLHNEVHVGLAVATENGLVVPVIHRADTLSLQEIAQRRKDMVERAQTGKLRPQDLQGGTFTISNLGMYGVDAFNAIINAPQAAILAVGRVAERVVAVHGQPVVQPMMVLSLSCDHRVVDGARGAQFLATLADLVEEPLGLLS